MPSSPVAPAVENTLGLFAGENEVARGVDGQLAPCHVFSYREDFYYLWDLTGEDRRSLGSDMGRLDQGRTVVLVNDGIPDMPDGMAGPSINVRDYITAYDWAVYFFLSCMDREAVPNIRLCILDVTGQQSNSSFAAQRLPGLLPLMPWLRVYRLSNLTDIQARFGNVGVGAARMAAELVGKETPSLKDAMHTDPGVVGAAKDLASEAWERHLTRPGGRHDVSNLTAPLLLASGLQSVKGLDSRKVLKAVIGKDPRRMALNRLLQSLGMLRPRQESEEPVSSPLDTPMVENNIFGQFDRVRFLLVDDQAALGYHDILDSLLAGENDSGEDGRFSLRSTTDPQPLVEGLFGINALLENGADEWDQPRVFDSTKQDREFDILLLDLRLFGDASASKTNPADFFERLVEFYKKSGAESIGDDRLDRAAEAAENWEEDTADLMHLALLPLLMSYVDPSLPIVLFSSTRQQAVVEALSHRPNIISSFHKPVISGYNEGTAPHDYVAHLTDAILDALRLHEARSAWKRLVHLTWKAQPIVKMRTGRGKFEIFNVPKELREPDALREGSEYNDYLELPVELSSRNLRRDWALYYQNYVQRSGLNDFASRPWEYFERHFTPTGVSNTSKVSNTSFRITDVDYNDSYWLYHVLQQMRHKKNHGSLPFPNNSEMKERYRTASLLLLHFFIDWIAEVSDFEEKTQLNLPNQELAWAYVRDAILGLDPDVYHTPRSPTSMASIKEMDGLDYLVYTCLFFWGKPTYRETGKGSMATANALASICRNIWSIENWDAQQIRHTTPHNDPMSMAGTGERVAGEVKFYDEVKQFGFVVNPKPGKDNDIYFDASSMAEKLQQGENIPDGALVNFVVVEGPKGAMVKKRSMERL